MYQIIGEWDNRVWADTVTIDAAIHSACKMSIASGMCHVWEIESYDKRIRGVANCGRFKWMTACKDCKGVGYTNGYVGGCGKCNGTGSIVEE